MLWNTGLKLIKLPIDKWLIMCYDTYMTKKEIKQLRKKLGLSQQAFASRLHVGIATVNRWETGDNKPSQLAEEKLHTLLAEFNKTVFVPCIKDKEE